MRKLWCFLMLSALLCTLLTPVCATQKAHQETTENKLSDRATPGGTCGENLAWQLDDTGVLTISGSGKMDECAACDAPWAAFAQQIHSVVLGQGVSSVCADAFTGLSNLTQFTVGTENDNFYAADGVLFHESTLVCYPAGNPAASYSVPQKVTEIGMAAFAGSQNLTYVILPAQAKLIGQRAFSQQRALTDLYFYTVDCCILRDAQTLGDADRVAIHAYRDSTAEAYCTAYGYTYRAIADCDSGRHDYLVTSQSATCAEGGTTIYQCSVCGDTRQILSAALGHDYLESRRLCVTTCTCIRCGDSYTVDSSVPITSGTTAEPFSLSGGNEAAHYFCFSPAHTDFYTFFTNLSASGVHETLTLYSASDGRVIRGLSNNDGAISLTFLAISGQRYYIQIDGDDPQGQTLVSLRLQQTHSFYQGSCEYCNTPEYGYCLAGGSCGEHLSWSVTNAGALVITGSGTMTDYTAQQDGAAPWALYRSQIQSLSLPDGLCSIGAHAFFGCVKLSSIHIPGSVSQVGEAAFAGCGSDLALTLGDNRSGCCLLDGVLYNSALTVLLYCPPNATQPIVLPQSVKRIGEAAFYRCALLPSLTLPVDLQSIGASAFYQCEALNALTIPAGITRIESDTFCGCTCLRNTSLPAQLTSIGSGAFYACSFAELTLPDGLTEIGQAAFAECNNLQRACIPDGVTVIRERTFSDCAALSELTLPHGLADIERSAFYNCSALTQVELPYTVTGIADKAFYNCISLRNVAFHGNAPALGADVFRYCSELGNCNIFGLYLSYFIGKGSWTTPLWNGYPTRCTTHDVHTYTQSVIRPATCTEDGVRSFLCTVCGDCYTEAIVAVGHAMTIASETPATCTDDGIRSYVCTVCGYCRTEAIPAVGHTPITDAEVPATCVTGGLTQGTHCSVCGAVLTARQPVAPFGHSYSAVLTTPAGCTTDGVTAYTCAVCGDTYKELIPAVGHIPITEPAVAATCTTNGLTQGEHCAVCHAILVAQQQIDALGHSYTEEITAPATCTAEGVKTFTCIRCGNSYTQAIAVIGHNYENNVCTVCGKTDYAQILAAFTDLPQAEHWAYPGIVFAVQNGLFNGTSATRFEPDGLMTRGMLVTVLWRYDGKHSGSGSFTDVAADQWYFDAVAWAAQQQIVNGVSGDKFDPDGKITREQLATILFRYCALQGIDVAKRDTLDAYPDTDKVSVWALDAVRWAVAAGLINGVSGYLAPRKSATRAQVAAIFMRLNQAIAP